MWEWVKTRRAVACLINDTTHRRCSDCSWCKRKTSRKCRRPRQRTLCSAGWDEDTCGGERREEKPGEWTKANRQDRSSLTFVCFDTWEEPVFAQETPRFWWSLSWGCRCRGGTEGWSRGPGLWARPASWRKMAALDTLGSLAPFNTIRLLSSASNLRENHAALWINDFNTGCWFSYKNTQRREWFCLKGSLCVCVCVLWIIQLSASFQSFLILFASTAMTLRNSHNKASIKEGVCLKATQSSLCPLTGSSLQTCQQHTYWLSEKRFWITQRKTLSFSLVSLLNKSSVWKSPRPDAQEVFLMPEQRGGLLTSSCQRWSL